MSKTKKYNHAVDIAFPVISNHPNGEDITSEMFREALLKRIKQLDKDDEWDEVALTSAPFDTHEI